MGDRDMVEDAGDSVVAAAVMADTQAVVMVVDTQVVVMEEDTPVVVMEEDTPVAVMEVEDPVAAMEDTQAVVVVDTMLAKVNHPLQLTPKTTTRIFRRRSALVLPSPHLILMLSLNLVRPIRD